MMMMAGYALLIGVAWQMNPASLLSFPSFPVGISGQAGLADQSEYHIQLD
jgi:hypothetical protein